MMPVYWAVYAWSSPFAAPSAVETASSMAIDPVQLRALPASLVAGFIVPTVLAALPLSTYAQQGFLAAWQIFPIWVALSQFLIVRFLRPSQRGTKPGTTSQQRRSILRRTYSTILAMTSVIHFATIAFAAYPQLRPAYFIVESRPAITLRSTFVPVLPFTTTTLPPFDQAVHSLLHYDMYFACGSSLLWATYMSFARSSSPISALGTLVKLLAITIFVGPGGAALAWSWQRDEDAYAKEKTL